jgi:hypothetical protein
VVCVVLWVYTRGVSGGDGELSRLLSVPYSV